MALVSSSPGYGDTPIRLPTQEQFLARVSAGRPWTTPQGVKSILQEEGFREIEVDVQKRVVEAGAPVAVVELMSMPIGMISKQWGGEGATEDVRNQVTKEVSGKLLELFQGEFEEQGPVKLKWEAILAVGRK